MCNNAMVYNSAETVYFKAAKKLQQLGEKLMSVVRVLIALLPGGPGDEEYARLSC